MFHNYQMKFHEMYVQLFHFFIYFKFPPICNIIFVKSKYLFKTTMSIITFSTCILSLLYKKYSVSVLLKSTSGESCFPCNKSFNKFYSTWNRILFFLLMNFFFNCTFLMTLIIFCKNKI